LIRAFFNWFVHYGRKKGSELAIPTWVLVSRCGLVYAQEAESSRNQLIVDSPLFQVLMQTEPSLDQLISRDVSGTHLCEVI
jgi:hypothetical protein